MKTIIAGSRDIVDEKLIHTVIDRRPLPWDITEVVSGEARGVDKVARTLAERYGIPVKKMPADWEKLGKAAGHIRNAQMANYAQALLAIWDGKSPGTTNMVLRARALRLKVFVYRTDWPKLLNIYKDKLEIAFSKNAVNIMRPSVWGNPYVVGRDGTRAECVEKHSAFVRSKPSLMKRIRKELKGRDLVCCCPSYQCHGWTLLQIANED